MWTIWDDYTPVSLIHILNEAVNPDPLVLMCFLFKLTPEVLTTALQ